MGTLNIQFQNGTSFNWTHGETREAITKWLVDFKRRALGFIRKEPALTKVFQGTRDDVKLEAYAHYMTRYAMTGEAPYDPTLPPVTITWADVQKWGDLIIYYVLTKQCKDNPGTYSDYLPDNDLMVSLAPALGDKIQFNCYLRPLIDYEPVDGNHRALN